MPLVAMGETDLKLIKPWLSTVSDHKYECPAPGNQERPSEYYIVQTVSCQDPEAVYIYDYKVKTHLIIDKNDAYLFTADWRQKG